MGIEIERKYLVEEPGCLKLQDGAMITQAYLARDPEIRVRITSAQGTETAELTVKGEGDLARLEISAPLDIEDARQLVEIAKHGTVTKTRFKIDYRDGLHWEIDIYSGNLKGLAVAEIELPSEEYSVVPPDWLGREITTEKAYKNVSLASADSPPGGDAFSKPS